jgi:hypothetical protein
VRDDVGDRQQHAQRHRLGHRRRVVGLELLAEHLDERGLAELRRVRASVRRGEPGEVRLRGRVRARERRRELCCVDLDGGIGAGPLFDADGDRCGLGQNSGVAAREEHRDGHGLGGDRGRVDDRRGCRNGSPGLGLRGSVRTGGRVAPGD